jgi:flagellar hook-associated protein 2
MSITPLTITGISSFSDDFQTILNRAVSIASLPLSAVQNDQIDLVAKKQLLTGFRSGVADLASAVSALAAFGDSRAVGASTSNANRVGVTVSGAVEPGVHTITEIESVARHASATSLSGYASSGATAVSSDGLLELVIGDHSYTIDLTAGGANHLEGLRDAINDLDAGVSASLLNTGNGENPYYLSLTAAATGLQALELRETAGLASSNLLTNTRPETGAVYSTNSGFDTPDATAVSSDGILQLVVGVDTYAIDLTGGGVNNLEGLRDAINASGAAVTAEISGAGPYRLRLTSGDGEAVELRETAGDAATNILTNAHQGANAVFKLDGLQVVKSDNVVGDVVDGLTFTILSTTTDGESVNITLSSNRASVASALGALVTAYNDAAALVNAQIGESAGLLSGDFIVRETQASLRALTTYTGSGAIKSLAELGIELDDQGVMSFDSSIFYSLSNADLDAVFDFFGSSTTGLANVAGRLDAISNPVTGLIRLQQDRYDEADARMQSQVDALTERINLMQTALSQKLALADTLLATLEAQQNMIDASIESLNLALYGKRED